MAKDHVHQDEHGLEVPNAEMGGSGVLFIQNLDVGYTIAVDLIGLSDEEGLPASGTPEVLVAKACSIFLGNAESILPEHVHTDVTMYRGRFTFTWVSAESFG